MNDQQKRVPSKKGWKWFNLISLGVTAVILLGVVIGNRGLSGLLARWASLETGWIIGAICCILGYWLLESIELYVLTRCLYQGVPFRSNVRTAMIGQLYSALTPLATGGQPVQLIYMQRDGLDTGGAASILLIKTVVYQVGILAVGLVALPASFGFFSVQVPAFGWITTGGVIINALFTGGMLLLAMSSRIARKLCFGTIHLLHRLHLLRNPESILDKARAQFDIYSQSTKRFEKKKPVAAWTVLLTIIQLVLLYSVPFLTYRALGYEGASFLHFLSAIALGSMVADMVPLPGGSGGAEGLFVLFFSLFFVEHDLLVALLLWRLITYYSGIVVGTVIMMVSRKRQRACIRLPL